MGLFSKKKQIDTEKSNSNKEIMRALFNEAVTDGDSYKIAFGYSQSLKVMDYLIVRKQTVTFASLIVGYRESDMSIVLVPTVSELDGFGEAQIFKNDEIKKAKIVSGEYVIYHAGGLMAGYTQFGVVAENDDEDLFPYIHQPDEAADFEAFWKRYSK